MDIRALVPKVGSPILGHGFLNVHSGRAIFAFYPIDISSTGFPSSPRSFGGIEVRAGGCGLLPEQTCLTDISGSWQSDGVIFADDIQVLSTDVAFFDGSVTSFPSKSDLKFRRILDPFYDSGSILNTTVEPDVNGENRLVIASHDADSVRRAIPDFYNCRVVQSPWGREVYGKVDLFWQLAEKQDVLCRLSPQVNGRGYNKIHVSILYATEELAQAARSIPEGPMVLRTLVRNMSDGYAP